MSIEVQNTGEHAIPNVAVTVDSFNYASNYAKLAANKRPIWVIEQGPGTPAKPPVSTQEVSNPGGGQTAYLNTWALGRLAAKKTARFTWRVVAVKSGSYTVHYSVAAGLAGRAKAQLASGGPAAGHFTIQIAGAPRSRTSTRTRARSYPANTTQRPSGGPPPRAQRSAPTSRRGSRVWPAVQAESRCFAIR